MNKRNFGKKGESLAADYLIQNGYEILTKNYYGSSGEVDIIAKRNNILHFVEVKSWNYYSFEDLEYSINKTKMTRIIKTAFEYIENNDLIDLDYSFDVIFNSKNETIHLLGAIGGDDLEIR